MNKMGLRTKVASGFVGLAAVVMVACGGEGTPTSTQTPPKTAPPIPAQASGSQVSNQDTTALRVEPLYGPIEWPTALRVKSLESVLKDAYGSGVNEDFDVALARVRSNLLTIQTPEGKISYGVRITGDYVIAGDMEIFDKTYGVWVVRGNPEHGGLIIRDSAGKDYRADKVIQPPGAIIHLAGQPESPTGIKLRSSDTLKLDEEVYVLIEDGVAGARRVVAYGSIYFALKGNRPTGAFIMLDKEGRVVGLPHNDPQRNYFGKNNGGFSLSSPDHVLGPLAK